MPGKRLIVVSAVLLLATVLFGTVAAFAQEGAARSVTGYVFGRDDRPLDGSIVYLKNTKTLAMKTFIAEKDGSFRFHGLSPNVDYEVYAEYQGKRSDARTVSSFDNRQTVKMNLRIDTK